jgi:hypothetical protein
MDDFHFEEIFDRGSTVPEFKEDEFSEEFDSGLEFEDILNAHGESTIPVVKRIGFDDFQILKTIGQGAYGKVTLLLICLYWINESCNKLGFPSEM